MSTMMLSMLFKTVEEMNFPQHNLSEEDLFNASSQEQQQSQYSSSSAPLSLERTISYSSRLADPVRPY